MEVIASEAGTSKSVVYRYFGGKDGLRSAIGADVVTRLRDAVVAAGSAPEDPEQALQAMILTYLEQAAASPNTYSFVLGSEAAASPESVLAFTRDLAALMAERLQELDPVNLPGRVAGIRSHAAIGLIRSAGESWIASGEDRPDALTLTTTVTSWLLHGLTSPAAASPTEADKENR